MKIKVYTASKLSKAPLWRQLITEWQEIEFTARWVTSYVSTAPDHPCFARVYWKHNHEDVAKADVVLLYAEKDEHLRGGLVEAGIGIALDKAVVVVGEHHDYGTWQYHSNVHRAPDLDYARVLLRTMVIK